MKQGFLLLITMIMWPCLSFAESPIFLTDIHTTATPAFTRMTFTLTKKTYGRVRSYTNPGRIEIEFANTYLRTSFSKKQFAHANIKQIIQTSGQFGSLKFVLILGENARFATHYVPGEVPGLIRLQLDVTSKNKVNPFKVSLQKMFQQGVTNTFQILSSEIPKPEPIVTKPKTIISAAKPIDYDAANQKRVTIVVLDAGHGGKDPGASGSRGVKEKDVVLRIARMLAAELNKYPNYRAVLTRNGDYYVPLRKRLRLARRDKADLFVAIHADAHYNRNATGSSVYVLSQHGASSEAARWLANRENYLELGTVPLNQLVDSDPMLKSVMVDLAQTATIDSSLRLGRRVLDALDDFSALHHTEVERAPFVVLKSPDIPSILVETGFITNPSEEQRLQDPAYQRQIVRAMRRGIEDYLKS